MPAGGPFSDAYPIESYPFGLTLLVRRRIGIWRGRRRWLLLRLAGGDYLLLKPVNGHRKGFESSGDLGGRHENPVGNAGGWIEIRDEVEEELGGRVPDHHGIGIAAVEHVIGQLDRKSVV